MGVGGRGGVGVGAGVGARAGTGTVVGAGAGAGVVRDTSTPFNQHNEFSPPGTHAGKYEHVHTLFITFLKFFHFCILLFVCVCLSVCVFV